GDEGPAARDRDRGRLAEADRDGDRLRPRPGAHDHLVVDRRRPELADRVAQSRSCGGTAPLSARRGAAWKPARIRQVWLSTRPSTVQVWRNTSTGSSPSPARVTLHDPGSAAGTGPPAGSVQRREPTLRGKIRHGRTAESEGTRSASRIWS